MREGSERGKEGGEKIEAENRSNKGSEERDGYREVEREKSQQDIWR